MAVGDINQLKGHGCSALHGIEISTGRAETAVAAERDEFEFSTVRAAVMMLSRKRKNTCLLYTSDAADDV